MSLPELFDLTGKVALVTGAGGGLGREFADALAEAGADIACVDLKPEAAAQTAAAVVKHGRRAASIACSVSCPRHPEWEGAEGHRAVLRGVGNRPAIGLAVGHR